MKCPICKKDGRDEDEIACIKCLGAHGATLREAWAKRNRLRESRRGRPHWDRLVRRGIGYRSELYRTEPWEDHQRVWTRDGRVVCLTSEPYGLSEDSMAQLFALAKKHDWAVLIDGGGWHYPGRTVLIRIWTRAAYGNGIGA